MIPTVPLWRQWAASSQWPVVCLINEVEGGYKRIYGTLSHQLINCNKNNKITSNNNNSEAKIKAKLRGADFPLNESVNRRETKLLG